MQLVRVQPSTPPPSPGAVFSTIVQLTSAAPAAPPPRFELFSKTEQLNSEPPDAPPPFEV